jgi:hypothetical protein
MPFSKWQLQQVIVDVQYERGWSYFDKCGSIVIALEDALGKPFAGSVPEMLRGELRNAAERIVVTYGPKGFNVTQQWVKTPARVEHLAPIGWEVVSAALSVGRQVTRTGVRFVHTAGAESWDEAAVALAKSPIVAGSEAWREQFGEGKVLAQSSLIEQGPTRLRVALDLHEYTVDGQLPADLAEMVPKFALVMDLDHQRIQKEPYSVSKTDLKDLIRSSWQRTRTIATVMGKQLGIPYGD